MGSVDPIRKREPTQEQLERLSKITNQNLRRFLLQLIEQGEEVTDHMLNPLADLEFDPTDMMETFALILKSAFRTERLSPPGGVVMVPSQPVDLEEEVKESATEEEEVEGVEFHGAVDLIDTVFGFTTLVGFEWDSFGPMSWYMSLETLNIEDPGAFICIRSEAEPLRAIARVEPKSSPEVFSAFLKDLFSENAAAYKVELLGGLPSRTENYRPDLIPAEIVKECYWDWMEWDSIQNPRSWTSLRDEVIGTLVEPDHLKRSLDVLKGVLGSCSTPEEVSQKLAKDREEAISEAASLSREDRRRILDNYFSMSYREMGRT